MLDVVLYGRPGSHARGHLECFRDGLRAHGIEAELRPTNALRSCALAVFWAHKQQLVIARQRSERHDYLVMERGYFGDRFAMTSLGFNGLNGHAQFHNEGSPAARWLKHGVAVQPWTQAGEYGVVMGQVPTDASLATCPNYPKWVNEAARRAVQMYGKPVFFRRHPHPAAASFRPAIPAIEGSLAQVLAGAAFVIAWNSNSTVDAALAGVPVIAGDRGSMAWDIAAHVVGAPLARPDRRQWLNNLAYCQWTHEEIREGAAWQHLQQRYARSAVAPPHRTGTS